jgi:hypothetical protein
MEFPAARVAAGQANIAHELIHVYIPNGNRMIAEGFAVYVQDEIGLNPAYPNFGVKVDQMVHCQVRSENRAKIDLASLDKIATPDRLEMQLGDNHLIDGWTYVFAGSFVRYLIETHGMDKFRALSARTPFMPGQRVVRTADDWSQIYGASLAVLEKNWKEKIEEVSCPSTQATETK